MKYEDARPLIESGDIIAFRRNDIVSRVIRMATESDYSHVGLAWPIAGRVMILEAVIPLIRIFPLSKLKPFYWISMGRPMTPAAEEFALSRIGENYSVPEAIRGYLGITKTDREWQCAEYVRSILETMNPGFRCRDTPTEVVREALIDGGRVSLVE